MPEAEDARSSVARLQVLAAAAIFSTGGAAIKATELTGWQVASLRSGIAAAALLLLLPATRSGWSWRSFAVGLAHGGTMLLFVLANKLTTSAATIFLQSTAPLHLVLLGPWLLGEPVRRRDVPFMIALAAGMGLLFAGADAPSSTAPAPLAGNLLALASGLCWAFTIVGLRWMGRAEQSSGTPGGTATAVVAGNLVAFAAALPFALPLDGIAGRDWALLVFLGVVQIGLAYALLTKAFRHVRALEASLLLLTEPVLNPVWAWLIHGETPGAWSLAGGAVIVGASVWQAARRGE